MTEKDKEENELYQAGRKECALENLRAAIRLFSGAFDLKEEDCNVARLLRERQDTINALRELCSNFGDNNWPDNLYLADIIEKHLGRHLCREKNLEISWSPE